MLLNFPSVFFLFSLLNIIILPANAADECSYPLAAGNTFIIFSHKNQKIQRKHSREREKNDLIIQIMQISFNIRNVSDSSWTLFSVIRSSAAVHPSRVLLLLLLLLLLPSLEPFVLPSVVVPLNQSETRKKIISIKITSKAHTNPSTEYGSLWHKDSGWEGREV